VLRAIVELWARELGGGGSCMVRGFMERCWDCRVQEHEMDGHVAGTEVMRCVFEDLGRNICSSEIT
jgi:hypothetical protein